MKKYKYLTVIVSVANAAPANTITEEAIITDKNYALIDQIEAHVMGAINNALGYLDIGVRDSTQGDVHEFVNHNSWLGTYSDPGKKGKVMNIKCDGRSVYLQVRNPSVMTAAQTVQGVFRMVDSLVEVQETSL